MSGPKKECFVVSVIGEEGSAQRLHADWVLDGIIRPTFEEHFKDYKVVRADHMNTPGLIDAQIIDKLLNADLVIADLTFLNPNAFYEIGIRHVVAKPIIHMNLATERIPFDISLYLSLKFSVTHPNDLVKARAGLKGMVDSVLADGYEVENPVTKARGRVKFEETATPVDKILQTEMENINDRLAAMERYIRMDGPQSRNDPLYNSFLSERSKYLLDARRRSSELEQGHTIIFEALEATPDALRKFLQESVSEGLIGDVMSAREDGNILEVSLAVQIPYDQLNRIGNAAKKRGIALRQA